MRLPRRQSRMTSGKYRDRETLESLRARPCKVCGKVMVSIDPRQKTCSMQCGFKNRHVPKISKACDNCGKQVVRYASQMRNFNYVACSPRCQQVLRNRAGIEQRLQKAKSSLKAKMKWHKEHERNRRKTSDDYKWYCRIKWWVKQPTIAVLDKWDKKLRSMIGTNRHREAVAKPPSEAKAIQKRKRRRRSAWIDKWNETCSEMILLFNREQKIERKKDPWVNTLAHWMTNHSKRMRIKEHQSRLKDCEQS